MAVNFYLDHYQNRVEQNLVEDLTIEAIKMYGVDVIYLPRDTISRDDIFGEDIETKFSDNYTLEMYLQNVDGFEGEGDLLTNFGIQIKESANFVVSKKRFTEQLVEGRPYEGDLLYFPLSRSLFEVNYVANENPFYQLGKLYTYQLTCSLFTFTHEHFDTSIEDIDNINKEQSIPEIINQGDNSQIETEGDEVIDFTESNPFGEF